MSFIPHRYRGTARRKPSAFSLISWEGLDSVSLMIFCKYIHYSRNLNELV